MIDNKIEIRGIVYHLGPNCWITTSGRKLSGWEKFFKGPYDWDDIQDFDFIDLYGNKHAIAVDESWEEGEASCIIGRIHWIQSHLKSEIMDLGLLQWKKLNGYEEVNG